MPLWLADLIQLLHHAYLYTMGGKPPFHEACAKVGMLYYVSISICVCKTRSNTKKAVPEGVD